MAGSIESSNDNEMVTAAGDRYLGFLSGVSTFVRIRRQIGTRNEMKRVSKEGLDYKGLLYSKFD